MKGIGIGYLVGILAAGVIGWFVRAVYQAFQDVRDSVAKTKKLRQARWAQLRVTSTVVALGLVGLLVAFAGMLTQRNSVQLEKSPTQTTTPGPAGLENHGR